MVLKRQSFAYYWRHFGMVQALGRTLAYLKVFGKYNSLDFYFIELPSWISTPGESAHLTVREIKTEEWRALRFADDSYSPEWVETQFSRNSRFFAVLEGDTVVGMNWISAGFADLTHINCPRVPILKGMAYVYATYVTPSYRKRGIGTLLKQTILKTLKEEGFGIVFATVFLKEAGPQRWQNTIGFKKWGRVTYIDLRVINFLWVRRTKEGRRFPDLFHA